MVGTIEELYFDWLCEKILSPRSPNYHDLLLVLHRTEFVWVILGDKNRAEYGIDLRHDFLRETHYMSESEWFDNPCSVLEMLVALAGMAQFETDIPTKKWFWIFMENL